MINPSDVHDQVKAVCPIDGISFGSLTDKTTWTVQFSETATDAQKQAAQSVLAAVDADASPVPAAISDRQFFQQLAVQGIITTADALAAVKAGTIPATLEGLIKQLPSDQQFGAEMIVAGNTTFERKNALTITIGAAYGWSSAQIDDFFRAASLL